MSWILWAIVYYVISRLVLICWTVLIADLELDPKSDEEPPMLFLICAPISGDFPTLISPFLLLFGFFVKFGGLVTTINNNLKSRRATKTKLLELRDLQVRLQEGALDKEFEEARHNYNNRKTTT